MNFSLAGGKDRVAIKDDVCVCVCVLFCVVRECVRGGGKESDEKAKESKGFLFSSNVIKKGCGNVSRKE